MLQQKNRQSGSVVTTGKRQKVDINITLHLENADFERVSKFSDIEVFANRAFKESLKRIPREEISKPKSKWAKFVDEANELDIPSETFEEIRKHSKEFREEFAFKHDLTD